MAANKQVNATFTTGGVLAATLILKADQLQKYRQVAHLDTQSKLAEAMGFDAGNLSRVLAGKQVPGPKFIAALMSAFPALTLDDLFEVVDTDPERAA
jgi:transcriptional regulator with XRE-family HTH domain